MKALLYVQHLLGIGHARRASLIAEALAAAGMQVTVAFGGFPVSGVDFAPVTCVRLPPARAADTGFKVVLDETGQPIDESWKARRKAQLLGLFADVNPDALIIETFPFGRRQFRFELEPLLAAARAMDGKLIASSVRDILVAKQDPAKEAEMAALARRWFDLVLVHGDPKLIPFAATFPFAEQIADLIQYTGYVVPQPPTGRGTDGVGEIIVSVGGGAVGEALLSAALAARPLSPLATATWRLLLGPDVPAATASALRTKAGAGVIVEPARPDFAALLQRCRLSISQAGYNTVMDVLAARCRSVLVPFAGSGESEQTIRARRLEDLGLVRMVEESALSPRTLAQAVAAALADPPAPPVVLRTDGAAVSAELVRQGVRRIRAGGAAL